MNKLFCDLLALTALMALEFNMLKSLGHLE